MKKLERRGQIDIHSDSGGFFVNIDPAGNLIHKDSCSENKNLDPGKQDGEILYFEEYEEADSYLKDNNIKFKNCDKCRP